ncbi:MAG: hypothetical protein IKU36_06160 [Bacteroidales bacterium]|nr:hypothetical protein [Bacteroidales bacterium]
MVRVKVKAPWFDDKGLHKVGELAEVETAAINPLLMEEVREKIKCEPVTIEPEKVDPEKIAKTTKKTTKKR